MHFFSSLGRFVRLRLKRCFELIIFSQLVQTGTFRGLSQQRCRQGPQSELTFGCAWQSPGNEPISWSIWSYAMMSVFANSFRAPVSPTECTDLGTLQTCPTCWELRVL